MWDALSCYVIGLRNEYPKDTRYMKKNKMMRTRSGYIYCKPNDHKFGEDKFYYLTTWEKNDAKLRKYI